MAKAEVTVLGSGIRELTVFGRDDACTAHRDQYRLKVLAFGWPHTRVAVLSSMVGDMLASDWRAISVALRSEGFHALVFEHMERWRMLMWDSKAQRFVRRASFPAISEAEHEEG